MLKNRFFALSKQNTIPDFFFVNLNNLVLKKHWLDFFNFGSVFLF